MTKKSKKSVLPKRIAGVKVPKSVRNGPIGEALASPTGQAVIAEVITAAASAKQGDKLVDLADRLRSSGEAKAGKASEESGAVVYAMGEAARTFVDALNRRRAAEADERKKQSAEGQTGTAGAVDSKKKTPPYEGVTH